MALQVACKGCGGTLRECAGAIATCPMGDELIESWFLCRACDQWTVELYHDRFMGDDWVGARGPVSRAEGDAAVARIARCPEPMRKFCDCEVHRAWR